jgi:hypothetical protein
MESYMKTAVCWVERPFSVVPSPSSKRRVTYHPDDGGGTNVYTALQPRKIGIFILVTVKTSNST